MLVSLTGLPLFTPTICGGCLSHNVAVAQDLEPRMRKLRDKQLFALGVSMATSMGHPQHGAGVLADLGRILTVTADDTGEKRTMRLIVCEHCLVLAEQQ